MQTLNLTQVNSVLDTRFPKEVETKSIIEFMSTNLDQTYKRSNNCIYWFQLFLNGDRLEQDFNNSNPGLHFIEDDHGILGDKARGEFIPDFKFTLNNIDYTLDTKTFADISGFNSMQFNNLEGAKFVIAFIISEQAYYIRVRIDGTKFYSLAIKMSELPEQLAKYVGWIKLPQTVSMIYFFDVNKEMLDTEIPEKVSYKIVTYNIK